MKKKNTALVILNSISLLIMLAANYVSNAGIFSKFSVADISHKYDTLFAPAGYTFLIWGFLFLMAISFVIFQWILIKNNDPQRYISRTGIWFTVSNISNASWLYFWTNEMLGWSVVLIIFLLISLIILTARLRLELDDRPVRIIFFVWWPITFYIGWIMVATIACIASWLVSLQLPTYWFSGTTLAIVMIAIAYVLYSALVIKRNMREAALVGVWAFIGIAFRQQNNSGICIAAIIASIFLMTSILVHIYKNFHYNIAAKLKRGEW